MTTRAAWLASLALLLALADSGQAQQPGAEPKQEPRDGAELVALNECVQQVRAAHPGSQFDAYVGARAQIRYLGTQTEIAAFKRCMETKGFPGDPNSTAPRTRSRPSS